MASKEALRRTAVAALQSWPRDPLRPTAQLGEVLSSRLSQTPPRFPGGDSLSSSSSPEQQVHAIVSLLNNEFSKRYALLPEKSLSGGMMSPRSNPGYYEELVKDLEDVPSRTWLGKMGIRIKGMFRWT